MLSHREVALARDHDVVEQLDAQELAGVDQALCHLFVFLAQRRCGLF
jgi:hypothetical protein